MDKPVQSFGQFIELGHHSAEVRINLYPNARHAIFLSGGTDSAVLLYWILSLNEQYKVGIDLTILRVAQGAQEEPRFLKFIDKKFGRQKVREELDNTASPPGAITEAIRKILKTTEYTTIFTGVNNNPSEDLVKFNGPYHVRPQTNPHHNLQLPFMNLYKFHVLQLGYQIGADELFANTKTCTKQRQGRCQICFACQERSWAFQFLNKSNPPE